MDMSRIDESEHRPALVTVQLSGEAYWRMTCVIVDCPACGAHRGEPCHGDRGNQWKGSLHSDRRVRAKSWRKRHRDKWQALKLQVVLQAQKEIETNGDH